MRNLLRVIKTGSLACTGEPGSGSAVSHVPRSCLLLGSPGRARGCRAGAGRRLLLAHQLSSSRPTAAVCFRRKKENPGRVMKLQQSRNPAQSLGKGSGLVGSAEGWAEAALDGRGWEAGVAPPGQDQQGWDPSPTPSPALSCRGLDPCCDNQRQGLAGFRSPHSTWHGNYVSYWCQLEVKL